MTRLAILLVCVAACGGGTEVAPTQKVGRGTTGGAGNAPAASTQSDAFRQTKPVPTKPRPFQLPELQAFKIANGRMQVYLLEDHTLPTVSVSLNLDGGTASDPKGAEGQAAICMELLTEGTERLTQNQFQEALADLASEIESYSGDDNHGVDFNTLSKNFDKTLALFVETLRTPGLREGDLKRSVARAADGIRQMKASAPSVARRLASNLVYGSEYPSGRLVTEASLGKQSVSRCKAFYKSYLQPTGGKLFVFGDLTKKQVTEAFEAVLKDWKAPANKKVTVGKPKTRKGTLFFADIPGSSQSTIYVMHLGPNRQDPEYFQQTLLARILGSGFASRINMNLREDKGYSYGARGDFRYTRRHGAFVASSQVRADATYQSVLELVREIEELQSGKRPPLAEELAREQNGEILALPAYFSTASGALGQYRSLVHYGLPLDTYAQYADRVSEVTLEQIQAAAKKTLRPQEAIILVVGDGKAPQIRRADGKDVPWKEGDKEVTLRDAVATLKKGAKVTVIDGDGKTVQ